MSFIELINHILQYRITLLDTVVFRTLKSLYPGQSSVVVPSRPSKLSEKSSVATIQDRPQPLPMGVAPDHLGLNAAVSNVDIATGIMGVPCVP